MKKNEMAGFSDIKTLVKNDKLTIQTALKSDPKIGGGIYYLLLEQNKYLSTLIHAFMSEKSDEYQKNYLDALRINNNIELSLSNPFYKLFQDGNSRALTDNLQKVQDDFIIWGNEHISKEQNTLEVKNKIDNQMSGVYSKATQIYLEAEQKLRALLPDKNLIKEAKKHNVAIMGETTEKKKFHDTLRDENNHLIQHIERVIYKATAS